MIDDRGRDAADDRAQLPSHLITNASQPSDHCTVRAPSHRLSAGATSSGSPLAISLAGRTLLFVAKPTRVHRLDRRTPVEEAAPRLLSARLADVRQWEARLRHEADEEAIHQMRVSARRLRAALELFDEEDQPLERQVKRLQDSLGEVRDLQVQLQWFRDRRHQRMPIIIRRLQKELARAEKELGGRFHIWEETAARIEQRLPDVGGKGRLGGHRVRRRVGKRMKQLARRIDDADRSLTTRSAHRARITVKKVRYLAELFEPAHPKLVARLLEELGALQDALGELHDADVRVARLQHGRLPAHADDLLAHAEADREHLAEEAAAKLSRWRKKRLARRLAKRL